MSSRWTIDPEELILQVERRPLLYSKSVKEYTNKKLKFDTWKVIAKNLSLDWDTLNKVERLTRAKKVQTKWKHIRDNFRREHYRTVSNTRGKSKKYLYYDILKFLIPEVKTAKSPRTPGTARTPRTPGSKVSTDEEIVLFEVQETNSNTNSNFNDSSTEYLDDSLGESSQNSFDTAKKKKSVFEELVLKPIDNGDSGSCADEDKAFCLSLVQPLRRMDFDSKMLAKIEILRVIHNHSHNTKT